MTDTPELKPCPFCGNSPSIETKGRWTDIACVYPFCSVGPATTKGDLVRIIEAWNRRAGDAER